MRKAIFCISDEGPLSENSLKKCDNHLKTLYFWHWDAWLYPHFYWTDIPFQSDCSIGHILLSDSFCLSGGQTRQGLWDRLKVPMVWRETESYKCLFLGYEDGTQHNPLHEAVHGENLDFGIRGLSNAGTRSLACYCGCLWQWTWCWHPCQIITRYFESANLLANFSQPTTFCISSK